MRKIYLFTAMMCLAGNMQQPVQAQKTYDFPENKGVIHPGLLHTQNTFDRIKKQLDEGNERTKQAYRQLETNCVAGQTWIWGPNVEILRGIAGNENYANVARSGSVIYQYALRYKITGNTSYADLVVSMLNAHAEVVKGIGGNTNMSLASGLYGYRLAESAELLRDYPGWKPEDFRKFQQWMVDVWFTRCYDFLRRRHDTVEREGNWYHYESNWGAANALTVISIGILCDDPAIYNIGSHYLKRSRACESFSDTESGKGEGYFPWRFEDPRGPYGELNMTSEFGRDQPHCVLAATLQLYSAETMWNQGDDLYAYNEHALAGGIEHLAGWNIFDKEGADREDFNTWPMQVRTAKPWQGNWEANRGRLTPAYYVATNHYQNRMHVPLKYAQRTVERIGFDGLWDINENNGKDWLHYNSLMYDDVPTATPYTELTGTIRQGTAVTVSPYPEMSEIKSGTALTLIASLPDTVQNTGKWRWVLPSGDEIAGTTTTTGSELKLTAGKSGFYRAYYTDKNGLENRQMFSLAVLGDAAFHTTMQYARFNGNTYENEPTLFVPKGSAIEFELSNNGWAYGETYKWYINGKETSSERVLRLERVLSDRTITVEVSNESGAKRSFNYDLTVSEVTPYISVNEENKGILTQIRINEGDKVKLWGEPVLMAQGGTSKWTDAEGKLLSENEVFAITPNYTSEYTLTYSAPTGKVTTWTFHVEVVSLNEPCNGEYLLEDKATGLYLTNTLTNDTLLFSELLDASMQETQTWSLKAENTNQGCYKFVSIADGRYIHNSGLLKKSLYTAGYHSYAIYDLTGSDLHAIQNSGKATPSWWKKDDVFNLVTNGTAQEEFPFRLHFLRYPSGVTEIEADQTPNNELKIYVQGRTVIMPEGCKLYTINGCEVDRTDNLLPGIYIVTRGSQKTKIRIL